MEEVNFSLQILYLSDRVLCNFSTEPKMIQLFKNCCVFMLCFQFAMKQPPNISANQRQEMRPVKIITVQVIQMLISFLGGLSLHLNHLIGSRVTNYDWPFGTFLVEFGHNGP